MEEIGQGGFAVVHRALDTTLEREVALKVLDPLLVRDAVWVERFRREARAVARLRHPHIVTIHEIGEAGGRLFIAMELVDGPPLNDLISERGGLPWEEMLEVVMQMADALDYAHGEGVLHRDLKPSNILLDQRRGAVLTDFGFARLVGESSLSVSISGGVVGTPAYIAPELWHNRPAGPASDLYALGCILYEMLAGEPAFRGDTPPAVMMAHFQPLRLPERWPPGVPGEVEGVLHRALDQEPGGRYASAQELMTDLAGLATGAQASTGEALLAADRPRPEPRRQARQEGERIIWERDGKEMVRVPAGPFPYGGTRRRIELPEFWIDRAPVTNAEYARFVAATGWKRPKHWKGSSPPEAIADHPVTYVSWHDAARYASWAGKRLPTQQEWEKAARGADGRRYPWGDSAPTRKVCNFGRKERGTTPVGKYSPQGDSPYGCADMAGNVWEWTASKAVLGSKVLRGGSCFGHPYTARCAYRDWRLPDDARNHTGFRCARSSE